MRLFKIDHFVQATGPESVVVKVRVTDGSHYDKGHLARVEEWTRDDVLTAIAIAEAVFGKPRKMLPKVIANGAGVGLIVFEREA